MNIFEKNEWVQVDIPNSLLHGKRLQIHKVNKETCDFVVDGEILRLYKTGLKSLKYPKVNKERQAVEIELKAIQREMLKDFAVLDRIKNDFCLGYKAAVKKYDELINNLLEGKR